MSERKWNLIFQGRNSREDTIRLIKWVFICSTILTGVLTIFGFILETTDFQWACLFYTIFFLIHTIGFYFTQSQYAILAFVLSITIGFPLWTYLQQDVSVISYMSLILIVTAGIFTKFWFTTAIFSFTLINLVILAFLDFFGILTNPNLPYPLSVLALLQIPLLCTGYLVAFYLNKILMGSLKTQNIQLQMLKETQDQLINQEKNKSIRLLAGGIAHDFNNLLTVILGNINLLRFDLASHESLELVEEVENATVQARDLTKELLTFSKETIHLSEVVEISKILKKSTKFASSGSKTKTNLTISDELYEVQGNPTQLAQVFQNLILNARQAMRDNPHGGTIYVEAENKLILEKNSFNVPHGPYVSIKVIDSGKGIQPEEISKIFSPYYTTKIGSHGLGLAICHTIVQNHKGSILVKSILGKETTFEIVIPAYNESIMEGMKTNADILVLEEDTNVIHGLKKNFQRVGYSMDFASSCEEITLLLKKSVENGHPYKIIIVDTTVPHDGNLCEQTQMLKTVNNNVKIVLSSDIAVHPIIKNYEQHGFDAFLAKPYQIRDIRNLIQSLTSSTS